MEEEEVQEDEAQEEQEPYEKIEVTFDEEAVARDFPQPAKEPDD